ncbi:hypothetical protein DFO77_110124 [Marinilabilia salmonicolor]|jgi:hypothetical protein|uniref:Uncharacterized protein n=1 Tax=Marinilabilia salmonicolor TaxID=989 RepID=A0A2T0XEP2_9BACT|nr:hypothetical protein BY457_11298 [Marinilabilia salmonicolor]RCW35357.1 hypothetical protein DFO77_110124 [Marinilabilia salmonicolor]
MVYLNMFFLYDFRLHDKIKQKPEMISPFLNRRTTVYKKEENTMAIGRI